MKRVDESGNRSFKFWPISCKGIPDRLCFFRPGRLVCVEVKDPKKDPTPMQQYWRGILEDLGFPYYVLDRDEVLDEILETYA